MRNETKVGISSGYDANLSDFALFLAVMANKEAYECMLSIVMEDPKLKLRDVKVEQVVLNQKGKRAIRLDAWAVDEYARQYNAEMQNDTGHDDLRKRSRFHQAMMDSPILKSGRKTRYRQLPPTSVIFITKDDIFKKDLVKYTFTEQCEEISGLYLEDGTMKLFLNMTSKNGTPEMVSLLQYMKNTTLDNPDILVKDKRILKLDEIVREVKESEEWEDAQMTIYSMGLEQGKKIGRERGRAQGRAQGRVQGRAQGKQIGYSNSVLAVLEQLGPVSPALKRKIQKQKDCSVLLKWLRKASTVTSLKEFEGFINQSLTDTDANSQK